MSNSVLKYLIPLLLLGVFCFQIKLHFFENNNKKVDALFLNTGSIAFSEICKLLRESNPTCLFPTSLSPSVLTRKKIEEVHYLDSSDSHKLQDNFLIIDEIPLIKYWQSKIQDRYVLHPMALGKYLLKQNANYNENLLKKLVNSIGATLPNGGLAFFYPKKYQLIRMIGPDYFYSSISQSEILSGMMAVDKRIATDYSNQILEATIQGLFLDHFKGGVNLSGVAQLELPLFRSNPEIILNGWLHALIRLNDYSLIYKKRYVSDYISRNLKFFIENSHAWYDKKKNISRYSDTSPYLVRITSKVPINNFKFNTAYISKNKKLSNYLITPDFEVQSKRGYYDNHVSFIDEKSRSLGLYLNCSQFFRTKIIANAPFSIKLNSTGYNTTESIPDRSGVEVEFSSQNSYHRNNYHVLDLKLNDDQFICGYPTNFAKANKKNYYHIQHVVALLLLANFGNFEDESLKKSMIEVAREWYINIEKFKYKKIVDFENPQKVLDGINRGAFIKHIISAEKLFSISGMKLFNDHRLIKQ